MSGEHTWDVVIVGCGVSGLTCGILLLEHGFSVTIVAEKRPPHTTSDVAAALWYPYRAKLDDVVVQWSKDSFNQFKDLCEVKNAGVSFIDCVELFKSRVEGPEWEEAGPTFRHAYPDELPEGYSDGYAFEAPLIETPEYMPYLEQRFLEEGRIETRRISTLSELYQDNRLIINCAGEEAGRLTGDKSVEPFRGQIVLIKPVEGVTRCLFDVSIPEEPTYIIPRSQDCVLGGTATKGRGSKRPVRKIREQIIQRCVQLEPLLEGLEVIDDKVGWRPAREDGVRLQPEQVSNSCAIIHNYGHDGAGFTLSWGCAKEVVRLATEFVASTQ